MWELDHKEGWMPVLFDCGAGEDSWEPLDARRSKQSILKDINPEYSLEGLLLKLQYFGHLMQRVDSLGKTLMLGNTKGRRRRRWQKMRWLDSINQPTGWIWVWSSSGSWWWTRKPGVLQSMGLQRVWHDWMTELMMMQKLAQHCKSTTCQYKF